MASYQNLVADRQPLERYRANIAAKTALAKGGHASPQLPVHLFEWFEGHQQGTERSGLMSAEKLISENQATVRVVFVPQDIPTSQIAEGLCDLFDRCNIPSAFIEEGLEGVSQSFAVRRHIDGSTYVWSHILAKVILISNGRIVHNAGTDDISHTQSISNAQAQSLSQANYSWVKPGFVLRISGESSSPPAPSRSSTTCSDETLPSCAMQPKVELFCFGAPISLHGRFQALKDLVSCEDLVHDPYMMLEVVTKDMHRFIDHAGWGISAIFGEVETNTLALAGMPGVATKKRSLDFTGLHNLCKNTIYIRETCESALATLDYLRDHHKSVIGDNPSPIQEATIQSFDYQKSLYQSTQRRLASLDARMTNIIELSFHIVTQGDSRMMQSESQSMRTIAVMTLLFMPLSTVATIFGTQFMKIQDDGPNHITVSQDFWLLWVIAIPLTIIVMMCWRVGYTDAKLRLIDENPRDTRRNMGWKTLLQTMKSTNKHGEGSAKAYRGSGDKV